MINTDKLVPSDQNYGSRLKMGTQEAKHAYCTRQKKNLFLRCGRIIVVRLVCMHKTYW